MDRELIEGLSNLSASLDRIYEALTRSGDPKSATAAALKMGNFEEQIKQITMSIVQIKEDTQKILNQQDTILKMLREGKDTPNETKIKKIPSEPTTPKIGRQKLEENQENVRDTKSKDTTDTSFSKLKKFFTELTTTKIAKERQENTKDSSISKSENIQSELTTTKIAKERQEDNKDSSISKSEKIQSELTTTKIAKERQEDTKVLKLEKQSSSEGFLTRLHTILKREKEESIEERKSKAVTSDLTTMKMSKDIEKDKRTEFKETPVKTKGEVSFWNRLFPNKSINEKVKILSDYFTKGIISKDDKKVKKTDTELTTVKIQIEKQYGGRTTKEDKTVKAFSKEPTTVKVSRDRKEDSKDSKDSKIKKVSEEPTTTKVAKEKRDERRESKEEKSKGGMFGSMDTKKIKDGVSAILLIAVGIVAIGLALKLVGKVDFVSVMAIALALPLIAIAFAKIASVFSGKEVTDERGRKSRSAAIDIKQLPAIILGLVGFSAAITASSYILSKVKPIGLAQAVTAILIGGVFSALSFGLHRLVGAFGKMSLLGGVKAVLFMPVVLVAVSTAIALSSYVLSAVKPIGIFQAVTAILIAGVFSVLGYGIGKLIRAFRGIDPVTAFMAAKMMPIVLLAVTATIAAASYLLSAVKPIGFFQALTAILIAGVFTVLSFGIGKIIGSFRRIDPATALAATAMMPLIFIALSFSIMMSSYFLGNVKVIGLFQALTAIAISIVFVALSFGLAKILPAFRRLSPADITKAAIGMPIIFTALSLAIMVSSYFISGVKPIGFAQFLTALGISILFVGFAFATKFIVKGLKGVTTAQVVNAMKMLLIVATTVAIASFIVSVAPSVPFMKTLQFGLLGIGLGATTVVMAIAIKTIKKIGLGLKDILTGGLMILAIATTIALSSVILNMGTYEKYPSWKWALGVGASLVGFGLAAVVLGSIASSGIGALAILAGLASILAIAGTIVLTDKIISAGTYQKYPGAKWILGVGATMVGFGLAAVTLGGIIVGTLGLGGLAIAAGLVAVIGIAETIVKVDKIIAKGNYTKSPGVRWILGVGSSMVGFGLAAVTLGGIIVGTLGLGGLAIKAGLSAVESIAKTIVKTDKILSAGQYTKYPGAAWALTVGSIITAFSTAVLLLGAVSSGGGLLQKLSLGLVKNPLESGIQAIKKIAQAIVDVDKKLAEGSYTKGPNPTWAKGISASLSAFSPIYRMLLAEKLMSFIGGVSAKDFAQAIKVISGGIVDSAKLFESAKVAFKNGPPVTWSKGVSASLGAFSSIYSLLVKDKIMSIFGSGISPKDFSQAIKTISGGIVDAAKLFGNAAVAFKNGPPVEWAKGISKALGAFSSIYSLLVKDRIMSIFGSGVSPKDFSQAIKTISGGIVDSAKLFDKASVAFKNGPPVEWANGVSKSLGAFSSIYKLLASNSGWWKSGVDPKMYAQAIVTITNGIVTAAKAFGSASVAFKNGPPVEWADGVGKSLSAFQPIYELLLKNSGWWKSGIDPKMYSQAIVTITSGIVTAAKAFGSASVAFKNGPPVEWADGVGKSLAAFQPIYELLLKNTGWWKSNIDPKKYAQAIVTITGGIITAAKSFSQASVAFKNGPPVQWAEGVGKALSAFQPVYELLVRNSSWWKTTIDPKKYAEAIVTITGGIVTAGKAFGAAAVAFKNGPPVKWAEGVGKALSAFQPVYEMLVRNASWWKSSIDPKKYSEAIRTISRGITDAAIVLSTASVAYKFYPTEQWASGVSRALTAFQPIYKILQKDSGWLRSGISPKMYADAIKTITTGIRDSAMILAQASIAYRMFPTVQWANGVSRALSVFQPIYKILEKDSGWLRSNISPEKYAKAIKTITTGIRDSAMILASASIAYRMFPTVQWANGVSRALSTFQPIYKILQKDSGWFRSNISPEKYATAIKTITTGIRDSAVILASASLAYRMFPTTQWADGVSKALSTFHPIYKILQKDSGWFRSNISPDKYAAAIRTISQGIVDSALILAKAKSAYKSFPTTEWADGVSRALSAFQPIYTILQKDSGWFKSGVSVGKYSEAIKTLSMGIVDSANILSKGLYKIYPTVNWVMGISGAFAMIPALIKKVNNIDFKGLSKIWMISDSIYKLSIAFKDAKFTSFPSKKWTSAISSSFTMMINLLKSIDKSISITSLLSGILKSKSLVNYILDLDKKFSLGKFNKFPNSNWVKGSTKSISEFAKLLSELNKLVSLVGLKTGQFKISSILKSVLDVDNQISRGKFNRVISQKWSSSLRVSILEFSNLFKNVDKLISIIDLKLGQTKVTSIIKSILQIDLQISKGKFNKFIDNKWIKGTKSSIIEFGGLFKTIDKLVSIISLKIGQTKVTSIIKSILQIDSQVSKGKFNKFIDNKWIKGTKQSVLEFGKLFIDVNKNFSVTSLLLGFNKVKMIFDNIIWIDNKISRAKFEKSPPTKWLTNTRDSIVYYGKLAIDSNKMFGTVPLIAGIKKIKTLVDTILWVDKTLSKGKYNRVPSLKWLNESKNAIFTYGKIAIDSNKIFPLISLIAGIKKVKMISEAILWVDKTLSKGSYTKVPTQNWLTRSKSTIFQYGNLAIESNKRFGTIGLFLGLKKVRNIADTLKYVSLVISGGNYTKFPSLEWSKSVPAAISGFMNLPFKGMFGQFFESIFGASEDSKKSQLGKIVDLMLYVDKRFQSGNWKKFPTVEWVKGTILALQKFKDIVSLLSFGSLNTKIMTAFGGKNPLVSAVSNIEKLAQSFDKLGNSMKNFSQSIKTLDTEKLAAIKSLSSNVILMSLMNPEQFDAMLSKLEERSGVFADLMKDVQDKKGTSAKTTGAPGTGQKVAGGGAMTDFKMVPSSTGARMSGKSDDAKMLEKLDAMTSLLADISSVVGSKGALKTYLGSLKEDVDIGDGGFSLFSRSDKRTKNILKKVGVSPDGINIYLFSYKFDPTVVYQGVIAQELLGTRFENSVVLDKSGYYAVDYSKLDVQFKRTN